MITREAIVAEARTWIGTRWRHQARTKGVGTDCIGLLIGVGVALGIPGASDADRDPDSKNYGRQPDPNVLLPGCDRYLARIPLAEAGLADILVMAFLRDPQHFAIISRVDPMYLIHAYAQRRAVVENGVKVAGAKVLRAYRFRGVA